MNTEEDWQSCHNCNTQLPSSCFYEKDHKVCIGCLNEMGIDYIKQLKDMGIDYESEENR